MIADWKNGGRISGSLITFLVPSIALDFLAELSYKGLFCICLCNSTKMQKGNDLIIPWRNQNTTFIAQYKSSLELFLYLSLRCSFYYLGISQKTSVY